MFVEMGEIVRAVGLRGEFKIVLSADFDERILGSSFARVRMRDGERRELDLEGLRAKGDTPILRSALASDRNQAEALVGASVGFEEEDYDRPDFPRPDPPSPFVYEGLELVSPDGERLGRVEELLVWPGQRMMRVARADGGGEALVPDVAPFVRERDLAGGRIVVEPIPGLLDDDEAETAG